MKITIYDRNLQKKTILFTWLSLLWTSKYNDVGSFVLELQENSELFGVVEEFDCVTFDEDPDSVMVVMGIEIKNKRLLISGYSAIYILDQRVSDTIVKNRNAESIMLMLVKRMTPWENLTIGKSKGIDEIFSRQKSDDSILNYCLTISQACDIGIRIIKQDNSLVFECYKPPLNNGVKFSSVLGNMINESYLSTDKDFKNVAIVAGAVIDGTRITVECGDVDSVGFERREMYVDARDIQPDETETIEEYQERLIDRGNAKLLERIKVRNTEFVLESSDVVLGDLVYIKPTYLDQSYQARITSMTYKSQENTMKKTVGIGTPIPTRRRS